LVGKAGAGATVHRRDWLLIPFSLLWCGFTIFFGGDRAVASAGALIHEALWRGVSCWLDYTLSRGDYAITNKRILIARSWPFAKFTALSVNRLPETSLVERANGRGTIHFGQSISNSWRGNSFSNWTPSLDPRASVHRHRKRPQRIRATSKRPGERHLALETMRRLGR
jgi:hypothetical protein